MKIVNKEKVKKYILQLIKKDNKNYISKAINTFDISKSCVYNYLNEMVNEGIIEKNGKDYSLKTYSMQYTFKNNTPLDEDYIYANYVSKHIQFSKNVKSIWSYAFTEIMNNAIDHSHATEIIIIISQNYLDTQITIIDNGIGIFRNIQKFIKETKNQDITLKECISLLFAGKFTTSQNFHTGEGIFFTSHVMDEFVIYSDNQIFTRNSFQSSQMENYQSKLMHGTIVSMSLDNHSKKVLKDVFDTYAPVDEGFVKTIIPIVHMFPDGYPVSRSEAKRLLSCISKFTDVTLDFKNVDEIGQGFTHELFVLGKQQYPHISLHRIHACKAVEDMIKRVLNTASL